MSGSLEEETANVDPNNRILAMTATTANDDIAPPEISLEDETAAAAAAAAVLGDDEEEEAPEATTSKEPAAKKQRVIAVETTTATSCKPRVRRVGTVVPAPPPPAVTEKAKETTEKKDHPGGGNKLQNRHDEKWNSMFQKLVAYKRSHNGSTMVPQCYHDDPRLGRWVHYQRVEYWTYQSTGKGKITAERIRRLEEIGMEWDPQRAQWNVMVIKLKTFAEAHGHCKVPKGYQADPELANWVRNQRLEYANLQRGKRSRMTQDRIDLLNSMGFKWSTSVPQRSKKSTNKGKPSRASSKAKTTGTSSPAADADGVAATEHPVTEEQVPVPVQKSEQEQSPPAADLMGPGLAV